MGCWDGRNPKGLWPGGQQQQQPKSKRRRKEQLARGAFSFFSLSLCLILLLLLLFLYKKIPNSLARFFFQVCIETSRRLLFFFFYIFLKCCRKELSTHTKKKERERERERRWLGCRAWHGRLTCLSGDRGSSRCTDTHTHSLCVAQSHSKWF